MKKKRLSEKYTVIIEEGASEEQKARAFGQCIQLAKDGSVAILREPTSVNFCGSQWTFGFSGNRSDDEIEHLWRVLSRLNYSGLGPLLVMQFGQVVSQDMNKMGRKANVRAPTLGDLYGEIGRPQAEAVLKQVIFPRIKLEHTESARTDPAIRSIQKAISVLEAQVDAMANGETGPCLPIWLVNDEDLVTQKSRELIDWRGAQLRDKASEIKTGINVLKSIVEAHEWSFRLKVKQERRWRHSIHEFLHFVGFSDEEVVRQENNWKEKFNLPGKTITKSAVEKLRKKFFTDILR